MCNDRRDAKLKLRCPACRAKQPLQNECRRCGAELSLLVAAMRHIELLRDQQVRAIADGDRKQAEQVNRELLQWMPNR